MSQAANMMLGGRSPRTSIVETDITGRLRMATEETRLVRWTLIGLSLAFLTLVLFVPLVAIFAEAFRKGVAAYFVVNMGYHRKLEQRQPAFLERVNNDPASGTPYVYTLSETKGAGHYRISVPDPKLYDAKDLSIEDGKLVQK